MASKVVASFLFTGELRFNVCMTCLNAAVARWGSITLHRIITESLGAKLCLIELDARGSFPPQYLLVSSASGFVSFYSHSIKMVGG